MQAIQGIYDNGRVKLDQKPSIIKSRVIVVFTEEHEREKSMSTE